MKPGNHQENNLERCQFLQDGASSDVLRDERRVRSSL